MSEPRSNRVWIILLTLLVSSLAPLASADSSEEVIEESEIFEPIFGDLSEMEYENAHPYMIPDGEQSLYSATRLMKSAWVDEGMPGADLQISATSGRSCTPYNTGDSATVPTSGGSIDEKEKKTTSTAAFMVQSGRTLSSTILNNWASTWDTTVYPTLTTYFGKDYFDGRGIAPPDVDSKALRETGDFIQKDQRVFNMLLPIRDGLMVCIKNEK